MPACSAQGMDRGNHPEIRPSRGTFVVKISVREVANARLVREAIESEIARHAARLAAPTHLDALRDLISRQKEAAAAGDCAGFNTLDETFHRTLADIAQNDFALRIVEAARFQTDRVRLLSLPDASSLNVLIEQHEAIVAGIEEPVSEEAARAMSRHPREILLALPSIAAAHPHFFDDTSAPPYTRDLVPDA